jgi:hypothetical protein
VADRFRIALGSFLRVSQDAGELGQKLRSERKAEDVPAKD